MSVVTLILAFLYFNKIIIAMNEFEKVLRNYFSPLKHISVCNVVCEPVKINFLDKLLNNTDSYAAQSCKVLSDFSQLGIS